MDYELEVNSERVTITTSGLVDVVDVERLVNELVSNARFTPGTPILADHSALDTRSLMAEGARRVGHIFIYFGNQIGRSPLAIVVGDKFTYGLVRMATAYAAGAPLKAKIFFSRDEAEAWLSEQSPTHADAQQRRDG